MPSCFADSPSDGANMSHTSRGARMARLESPGIKSWKISITLPLMPAARLVRPVTLLPGRGRLCTARVVNGSAELVMTIGIVHVRASTARAVLPPSTTMRSTPEFTSSDCQPGQVRHAAVAPFCDQDEIASLHIALLGQRLQKRLQLALKRRREAQETDPPQALALLRARRERPRGRASEQRDELAPSHHSITSSARASNLSGISRPSALAVLRLITNSNLVGSTTGSSVGLSPLRMRPV